MALAPDALAGAIDGASDAASPMAATNGSATKAARNEATADEFPLPRFVAAPSPAEPSALRTLAALDCSKLIKHSLRTVAINVDRRGARQRLLNACKAG